MQKRLFIIVGSVIAFIVVGTIVWYLASFRFVSEVVDEASSPGVPSQERLVQTPETGAEPTQITGEERPAVETEVLETVTAMPDEMADVPTSTETQATATETAQTLPSETPATEPQPTKVQVLEPQPTETQPTETQTPKPQPTESQAIETQPTQAGPIVILQGQFKDIDSVHKGSGTATIYQRPDGTYFLSFEDFAVCCGPDLYVFLANNPSPTSHADLGDYLELSSLKASSGDQDYEISADTDLSEIKSVVIYCKPFQVIISTATLG